MDIPIKELLTMQTAQDVPSRQHFYWRFRVFARVALMLVVLMSVAACQMSGISSAAQSSAPTAAAPTTSATSVTSISAIDFSTVIRDVAPLNPVITSRLGISAKKGVLIVTVQPGSPAAVAGLQARDVVTQIDSAGVADDSAFAEILNSHKPGDTITLTVLRSQQTLQLKAILAQQPSS